MPKTPMVPNEGNPKGYFESKKLYELHRDILESAGTQWDDWTAFHTGWLSSNKANEFRDKAVELLDEEFGSSRFFAIKDPRLCRIAPFWIETLKELKIRPLILHTHRHPVEVALSLKERNAFDPQYSILLWLRYVLEAEISTRGQARYFTSYSRLLTNWPNVATGIETSLNINFSRMGTRTANTVDGFLTPSLRHFQAGKAIGTKTIRLSPWVQEVYDILENWALDCENEDDYARLDSIRIDFDNDGMAFGTLVNDGLRTRDQLAKLSEAQKEIAALEQNLTEMQKAITTVEQDREAEKTQATTQLHSIKKAATQAESRLAALETQLQEQTAKNDTLDKQLENQKKQRTEAENHLAELKKQLQTQTTHKETIEKQLAEQKKQRAEAADHLSKLEKEVQAQTTQNSALRDTLTKRKTHYEKATAKVTELQKQLDILAAKNDSTFTRLGEAQKQIQDAESKTAILEEQYNAEKQARATVQEDIARIRAELEAEAEQRSDLEEELKTTRDELWQTQSTLSQRSLEAEQASAEIDRLKLVSEDLAQAKEENQALSDHLTTRFEELSQLTRMFKDVEAQHKSLLEEQATAHQKELRQISKTLDAKALSLEEAETEAATLNKQLETRFDELAQLTRMLHDADMQINTELALQDRHHKEHLTKRNEEHREALEARNVAVAELEMALSRSTAEAQKLTAVLEERDRHHNDQITKMHEAQRKLQAQQDINLSQSADQVQTLTRHLANSQNRVEDLQKTLLRKEADFQAMLQLERQRAAQAEHDYYAIHNSTVWRMSAPLRRLVMVLRGSRSN